MGWWFSLDLELWVVIVIFWSDGRLNSKLKSKITHKSLNYYITANLALKLSNAPIKSLNYLNPTKQILIDQFFIQSWTEQTCEGHLPRPQGYLCNSA